MKKLLSILFALLFSCVTIFTSACFDDYLGTIGAGTSKKLEIVGEVSMTYEYNSYVGYSAEIKGVVKNNSSKTYSYVSVEFVVYDVNGNNLGTALDNMNNLFPGDTWSFTAILFMAETQPASCKLVEVYGF